MKQTNIQHQNYTQFHRDYQLAIPFDCEMLITEDDSVRLLSYLLEGLNYENLYKAYSSTGRKPAVEPKILFKVLTYAYSNNIYTSRKIEAACRRDINFMWLLGGNKAPDHSTISRFRKNYLADSLEDLFYQFVLCLKDMGEIDFENIFIDGTKIEANANRYTFVWRKVVSKNEVKMFEKIQLVVKEINEFYLSEFKVEKDTILGDLNKILNYLEVKKDDQKVEFVFGSGKRKTKLQKFIKLIQDFFERQEKYDLCNKTFEDRNSYSKTDTDATFMHMKEDHMRNSQLKPGYNVQIGVEGEYIVGLGIFSNRNDIGTLIPFLNSLEQHIKSRFRNIIADSGYESEENYMHLENHHQIYYIKPQTYEKWKKKSFKNDISKRENMIYDSAKDEYTCHNGKQLKVTGTFNKKSSSGYISKVTMYECEDCSTCTYKSKCTKAQGNRAMRESKNFVEKRQKSYENIISKKGILLRLNRSIQAEGAFGELKWDSNFNRFLTRGKNNVKNEFLLLCLGYDINKLHAKIQNNRCKEQLHEVKTA
jgi:transposase